MRLVAKEGILDTSIKARAYYDAFQVPSPPFPFVVCALLISQCKTRMASGFECILVDLVYAIIGCMRTPLVRCFVILSGCS